MEKLKINLKNCYGISSLEYEFDFGSSTDDKPRKTDTSILMGKLFDESGMALTPTHAVKQGRRYRYYVSHSLLTKTASQSNHGWRLPAQEIEQTVIRAIQSILGDYNALISALRDAGVVTYHLPDILTHANAAAAKLDLPHEACLLIPTLLECADLSRDGVRLTLNLTSLLAQGLQRITITRHFPMQLKRRGIEMRLVIKGATTPANIDPILIKTIARAHAWFEELVSGGVKNMSTLAQREGVTDRYIAQHLDLAFLAPAIIETIIAGKQPVDLTVDRLIKQLDLPMEWKAQARLLASL
jgi:site-specific DNA recombinase